MRRTDTGDRDRHYYGLTKLFTWWLRCLLDRFSHFLLVPSLLCLQPLEEPFPCGDDPMALHVTLEECRMLLYLSPDPLYVHFRLRALHLILWEIRTLAPRQQRFCNLAPVTVHHVRLVELDLEEER